MVSQTCCAHADMHVVAAHGKDGAVKVEWWCPACGHREMRDMVDEKKLPVNTVMR